MTRHHRAERGNASIEVAIGAPAIVLFFALVILGGRTALAHQAVQAAAADAARTASIARTQTEAHAQASRTAAATLANQGVTCSPHTVSWTPASSAGHPERPPRWSPRSPATSPPAIWACPGRGGSP